MSSVPPPDLPNFEFVKPLGRGGFAEVFLYRQALPARQVAVKVLRARAESGAERERFEWEANRMAMLSGHPGIVTVYDVGVAPDGRLYLTMEYCPHDHFGQIVQVKQLSVARVLEVGVKVAGAVEAAHRAGILHRDIKPANILMTAYGEPALTDFGIAGGRDADGLLESQGVSVPFAAPEVLSGQSAGDEASDVYSLAATVYALLARRPPFPRPPGTSERDQMARILQGTPPPTGRPDAPASLERLLCTAMSLDPRNRPTSAAALGRALQGVEVELGLPQTALRVAETEEVVARQRGDEDDDGTRLRNPQRVDPDGPSAEISAMPVRFDRVPESRVPVLDPLPVPTPTEGHTVPRPSAPPPPSPVAEPEPTGGSSLSRAAILGSAAAVVVLVVVVGVIALTSGGGGADASTTTTVPDPDAFEIPVAPSAPTEVTLVRVAESELELSWSPVAPEDGDTYRVVVTRAGAQTPLEDSASTTVRIEHDGTSPLCATVRTIRGGEVSRASEEACT